MYKTFSTFFPNLSLASTVMTLYPVEIILSSLKLPFSSVNIWLPFKVMNETFLATPVMAMTDDVATVPSLGLVIETIGPSAKFLASRAP